MRVLNLQGLRTEQIRYLNAGSRSADAGMDDPPQRLLLEAVPRVVIDRHAGPCADPLCCRSLLRGHRLRGQPGNAIVARTARTAWKVAGSLPLAAHAASFRPVSAPVGTIIPPKYTHRIKSGPSCIWMVLWRDKLLGTTVSSAAAGVLEERLFWIGTRCGGGVSLGGYFRLLHKAVSISSA
jgi:hypothetical protein